MIIKDNRLHFILSELANTYGCKVLHIVRNSMDVWQSIVETGKTFWIEENYMMLRDNFEVEDADTLYKKFLVTWKLFNDVAIRQAEENSNIRVVQYERLDKEVWDVEKWLGVEFDRSVKIRIETTFRRA